ncbi:YhzD family protein [Bacillus dakarensis]|uniref:YhzD family protein n=1 Tax=Robertmurraya dakarensis TaxID=1926278 RepID=UPI000981CBC5|nr:YhzD family protein [Bacillus dakarensis]
MKAYKITAFESSGEKILDETFEAKDDQEAKVRAEEILKENNALEKAHRCISPDAQLLLFRS